jgi:uncharacterized protein YndB with AHSA1/START domain
VTWFRKFGKVKESGGDVMSTDQIENSVVLEAPRAEVWRALSDTKAFGEWFGVQLNGVFTPGALVRGKVTLKGYEDIPIELKIERMEAERFLSWQWHPYAIDPQIDYSKEPTTLVVFELEGVPGGTRLHVRESGFEAIPASRRLEAYEANEKGWNMQMESIQRYLKKAA